MADDQRSHLWIPAGRVTNEPFVPTAGGKSITREDYGAHGRGLLEQYSGTRRAHLEKEDASLTRDVIIQVATPADVPVRQEKARLESLGFQIISYSRRGDNRANTMIARGAFEALERRISRYADDPNHPGRSSLAAIESISEIPAEDKVDPTVLSMGADHPIRCLVAIYSILSVEEKVAIGQALSRRLSTQPRGLTRIRSFPNNTFAISTQLTAAEALDLAGRFASIRSIRPSGRAIITRATPLTAIPPGTLVSPPVFEYPVIVVDSGISAATGPLKGLVVAERRHIPGGSVGVDPSHGTFVASRVAFGDDLDRRIQTGVLEPQCCLIDVPVFGVDAAGETVSPDEDDLIDAIKLAVDEFHGQTKVVNLSLGFDSVVRDGQFTDLAKNLDFLAREYDMLFVIAAGNISSPSLPHPSHFAETGSRIQPPAETLSALCVGSLALHSDNGSLSKPNEVSPFSCRGPGADQGQKPEVMAHGGNVDSSWSSRARIATYGLDTSGSEVSFDVGTSFAAPLVAQSAARLAVEYPSAPSEMLKALLCHFTQAVSSPSVPGVDARDLVGLGTPDLARALYAGPYSVAYLHRGGLVRNTYQHVPFYVPQAVVGAGNRGLRVRVTLAYTPPVNPDNDAEYSNARVVCSMHKRVSVGFRQVVLSEHVVHPWSPLIHFDKVFKRKFASGDWEVRLRLMTRGTVPTDFEQRYALIVELVDESGTVDLRSEILRESPAAAREIQLRSAA